MEWIHGMTIFMTIFFSSSLDSISSCDKMVQFWWALVFFSFLHNFCLALGNGALERLNLIPNSKERKDASFTSKKHKLQNTNIQFSTTQSDLRLGLMQWVRRNLPMDERYLMPQKNRKKKHTYFHRWTIAHLIYLIFRYPVWIVWYTAVC